MDMAGAGLCWRARDGGSGPGLAFTEAGPGLAFTEAGRGPRGRRKWNQDGGRGTTEAGRGLRARDSIVPVSLSRAVKLTTPIEGWRILFWGRGRDCMLMVVVVVAAG